MIVHFCLWFFFKKHQNEYKTSAKNAPIFVMQRLITGLD